MSNHRPHTGGRRRGRARSRIRRRDPVGTIRSRRLGEPRKEAGSRHVLEGHELGRTVNHTDRVRVFLVELPRIKRPSHALFKGGELMRRKGHAMCVPPVRVHGFVESTALAVVHKVDRVLVDTVVNGEIQAIDNLRGHAPVAGSVLNGRPALTRNGFVVEQLVAIVKLFEDAISATLVVWPLSSAATMCGSPEERKGNSRAQWSGP